MKKLSYHAFKKIIKESLPGKGIHSKNDLDMYSSKDLHQFRTSFIKIDQDLNKLIISINEADQEMEEKAVLIRLKNFTK